MSNKEYIPSRPVPISEANDLAIEATCSKEELANG